MTINNGYLSIPITADRDTMIQQALFNIATSIPGWQPREGNLEVLLLEQFAEMSAEAAQVAAQVPLSIFSYYGSLIGVTQSTGTSAIISTTWTLTAPQSTPVTFQAGTTGSVVIGNTNYQFSTNSAFTVPAGSTVATGILMTAASPGSSYNSAYNGATTNYLTPTWAYSNLASVQVNSLSTSGTDPENTTNFLNRLSNALTTYTPRPITANDYAILSQQVYGINRVTALNNTNAFINLLSNSQSIPATSGFSAIASGGSVSGATSFSGISFTPSATGSSFAVAAVGPSSGAAGFIPFSSTLTSAAVTGNSVPVASTSGWATTGGYGYLLNGSSLVGFSYAGITGSTLTSCSYFGAITPTGVASGATVAYAGPTNWWTTTTATPVASNLNAGYGLAVALVQTGGPAEAAVIQGVQTTSGAIGFSTSSIRNAYTSGTKLVIAPGVTTGAISVTSNGVNLIGKITVQSATTDTNVFPLLTATVTYQNISGSYVYYSDPGTIDNYTVPQSLSVFIPGTSPNAYTGSIADPVISGNFYPNVSSVTLNVYWANAAAGSAKYVTLASLYQTNKNFSYYKNGSWYSNGSILGNPGSILPDGLFNSSYQYEAPSSLYVGANQSVYVINNYGVGGGSIALTSSNGWPTSGVGSFASTNGTSHFFYYTGITNNTLTGVSISNASSLVSADSVAANATLMSCMTFQNTPNMWTISAPSGSGQLTPLPGVGIQFTPTSTTTTTSASATSEVFSMTSNTNYVVDYSVDFTNITGSVYPYVSLVTTAGAVLGTFGATGTLPTGSGVYRSTLLYPSGSITTNQDVRAVVNFPSGMVNGGGTVVKGFQIVPLVNTLAQDTITNTNYAYYLDFFGPTTPGPMWLSPGPGPYVTSGGQTTSGYPRNVTVIAANTSGLNPTLSVLQNTQNYLASYREINFGVNVVAPNYALIDVQYSVYATRGYDAATIQNSIISNLTNLISPYNWASNSTSSETWDSSQTVLRYLDVVGLIDDAQGVANIISVFIGLHGNTLGTSDINFATAVPSPAIGVLPVLGTVTAGVIQSNSTVFEISGQVGY